MQILRSIEEVRAYTRAVHGAGQRLALVPTMGALHSGHLALVRTAQAHAERVVMSIFVNPTQFAPNEDFDAYPRDERGDLDKAEAAGVHAVFLPQAHEIYTPDAATVVSVPSLATQLCGGSRPHHFAGVCTIVSKLFLITGCDVAVFGEKDYQQLAIIRRMTLDLNLPVQVVGHPIERAADGLALSSRNRYLNEAQRTEAPRLYASLQAAQRAFEAGERDAERLRALVRAQLEAVPGLQVDYVSVVDAADLQPIEGALERPALVALAALFGRTRLIDNLVLTEP